MNHSRWRRRSFTLMELIAAILIIGVLATTVLMALYGTLENAKRNRTRAQIQKLHELIIDKWESYQTRAIRLQLTGNDRQNVPIANGAKLLALRDLMRMELPDRISDLSAAPVTLQLPPSTSNSLTPPSIWRAYRRRAGFARGSTTPPATWTPAHQGSECLYLILSLMRDGDTAGIDFFKESEIGDTDGDGMLEILDSWGRPIEFVRWAPGYSISTGNDLAWGFAGVDDDGVNGTDDLGERGYQGSDDQLVSDIQLPDLDKFPDPFDPLQVDDDMRRALNLGARTNFALVPLIFSAGPDQFYDVITEDGSAPISYAVMPLRNDPYYVISAAGGRPEMQLGTPWDSNGDGVDNSVDNITNHLLAE